MGKPLRRSDLASMEEGLLRNIDADKRYWQVNAVKCDAVHTAKSYEEFSDRVAAAHLRPLEKKDTLGNKGPVCWNPIASPPPPHLATTPE